MPVLTTIANMIRLLLPITIGFITGYLFPLTNAGEDIKARPESGFFSIIWGVLYVLIGITWVFAAQFGIVYDVMFLLLVVLLSSWVYVYGYLDDKKNALYILYLSSILVIGLAYSISTRGSQTCLFLIPLIVWLAAAISLNYTEVNDS